MAPGCSRRKVGAWLPNLEAIRVFATPLGVCALSALLLPWWRLARRPTAAAWPKSLRGVRGSHRRRCRGIACVVLCPRGGQASRARASGSGRVPLPGWCARRRQDAHPGHLVRWVIGGRPAQPGVCPCLAHGLVRDRRNGGSRACGEGDGRTRCGAHGLRVERVGEDGRSAPGAVPKVRTSGRETL